MPKRFYNSLYPKKYRQRCTSAEMSHNQSSLKPPVCDYNSNVLTSCTGDQCYLVTIDGVMHLIISDGIASIIDGWSNFKDIDRVFDSNPVPFAESGDDTSTERIEHRDATPTESEDEDQMDDLKRYHKKKFKKVISEQLSEILKPVKYIKLCLITHGHPDHYNLIWDILKDKEVKMFLLGGSPTAYCRTEGEEFLKFIAKKCKEYKETKVYLTIYNDDISSSFRSDNYEILKEFHLYQGINFKSPGESEKYNDQIDVISSDNMTVPFAQYLKYGTVRLTLFNVNPCCHFKVKNEIKTSLRCDNADLDAQCMIVQANVNGHTVTFTGDSNIRGQMDACKHIKQQTGGTATELLVVAKNSAFSSNSTDDLAYLTCANSELSLTMWAPYVYLLPLSTKNSQPKYAFIQKITDILATRNSLTMPEHEIIMFMTPNELFEDEDEPGPSNKKSKKSPDYEDKRPLNKKFRNYLSANAFSFKSSQQVEGTRLHSAFVSTNLPIITLHRNISISFENEKLTFHQPLQ